MDGDDAETLQLVNNGLRMRVANLQRQLEERDQVAAELRSQVLRVCEEAENTTAHCHTLKHVRARAGTCIVPCSCGVCASF